MRLIYGRGSITILRERFLAAVPLAHAWEAEVTKTAAEQGSQRRGTLNGRRPETVRRLLISQAIACSRMDYRTKQRGQNTGRQGRRSQARWMRVSFHEHS